MTEIKAPKGQFLRVVLIDQAMHQHDADVAGSLGNHVERVACQRCADALGKVVESFRRHFEDVEEIAGL